MAPRPQQSHQNSTWRSSLCHPPTCLQARNVNSAGKAQHGRTVGLYSQKKKRPLRKAPSVAQHVWFSVGAIHEDSVTNGLTTALLFQVIKSELDQIHQSVFTYVGIVTERSCVAKR